MIYYAFFLCWLNGIHREEWNCLEVISFPEPLLNFAVPLESLQKLLRQNSMMRRYSAEIFIRVNFLPVCLHAWTLLSFTVNSHQFRMVQLPRQEADRCIHATEQNDAFGMRKILARRCYAIKTKTIFYSITSPIFFKRSNNIRKSTHIIAYELTS